MHANGIQPSASFFRPSKPNQASPSSPRLFSFDQDDIQLSHMKRQSESSIGTGTEDHYKSSTLAGRDNPKSPTSLDLVFNIRRGFSTDIPRKVVDSTIHSRSPSHSTEQPDLFNPLPPVSQPPLSTVPIPDKKSPNTPLRNYRLHRSRNRFFLDGRILTGGDSPWAFIGCLAIVVTISGLWFGTTCVWWWTQWGRGGQAIAVLGGYCLLLILSTMFTTAFSDPGILPRNLDPDPPYPTTDASEGVRIPLPRDLKVRNDVIRVKYCQTCKTYRPPRSSHCKMCDNCVDACDHHCQWVNNCIGRRNYGTFFALLVFATLTLIFVIVTTALQLYLQAHSVDHTSFREAISSWYGIGSAIAFSISICVIWPVGALLAYHIRLVLLNVTTIEQIRNQAHKVMPDAPPPPPNPFSHGTWFRNLISVLCRPSGYSWLDPRGFATEDKREINPGFAVKQG